MKKVGLVFVLAVFVPSLVLAWLAIRSVRDQQTIVERQQTLLYQGVADTLAKAVQDFLAELQRDFAQQVETFLTKREAREVASRFDEQLRPVWPLAEVAFAVSLDGNVLSPSMVARPAARRFRLENDRFFCCDTVEVYWNSPKGPINLSKLDEKSSATPPQGKTAITNAEPEKKGDGSFYGTKSKSFAGSKEGEPPGKAVPGEAEFRKLVGDSYEGTLARFLENKLKLLIWYRSTHDPQIVFGAQLDLRQVVAGVKNMIEPPTSLQSEISVALLDDTGKPLAGQPQPRQQPFVTRDIGEALPHWAVAVYLQNPAQLTHSAQTLKLTLTLMVGLLILAIGIGGVLVVIDVKRQLALARQKTDFVSNVSHELKTPLTSIRMFSELLAEGRVQQEDRRQHFLQIITAETARLTRLINNVLDFARLDRGEQKFRFTRCDLKAVAAETIAAYRPHLEANSFKLQCELPSAPILVEGDRDALAQVMVNLISNAEKYSGELKEIFIQLVDGPEMQFRVLDRGLGVPRGFETRIFEQFCRAHDSLSSGIQGSGLGLTLARRIARAHGGDVVYEPREGGGSCFVLKLPGSKDGIPARHPR